MGVINEKRNKIYSRIALRWCSWNQLGGGGLGRRGGRYRGVLVWIERKFEGLGSQGHKLYYSFLAVKYIFVRCEKSIRFIYIFRRVREFYFMSILLVVLPREGEVSLQKNFLKMVW